MVVTADPWCVVAGNFKRRMSSRFTWGKLQKIDPSMPSTRFRKMQIKMTKGQAALYIQLHTGHIPLNKHLHTFQVINSPVCTACGMGHETVKHYLLDCPATERKRACMMAKIGRETRSIVTLLSHEKALRPLMKFIRRMKRFGEEYGTMDKFGLVSAMNSIVSDEIIGRNHCLYIFSNVFYGNSDQRPPAPAVQYLEIPTRAHQSDSKTFITTQSKRL